MNKCSSSCIFTQDRIVVDLLTAEVYTSTNQNFHSPQTLNPFGDFSSEWRGELWRPQVFFWVFNESCRPTGQTLNTSCMGCQRGSVIQAPLFLRGARVEVRSLLPVLFMVSTVWTRPFAVSHRRRGSKCFKTDIKKKLLMRGKVIVFLCQANVWQS